MAVRDTSLIAFDKLRLEPAEAAVLAVLDELGPCHDRRIMEALNQKEQATLKPKRLRRKWEINSVTGRRHALVNQHSIVEDIGKYTGLWRGEKKTYHFWRVAGDTREPAWRKVEAEPVCMEPPRPPQEQPTRRMIVSEAARILVSERKRISKPQPGQMELGFA